jgi:hypothetical protein
MPSQPPPELSSITSALEDLTARISKMADQAEHDEQNNIAYELFEVERALTPAIRRLTRLVNR